VLKLRELLARLGNIGNTESASTTENDDIEERVGTESVGTVDGSTGSLVRMK
jgi:hypothetical protein